MTTKEFIKMLQEADPEGNAHIRGFGGVPYYAELKPGYYDGSYSYINEEGKYVSTTQGIKVDIYFKEWDDYVWDNKMQWDKRKESVEEAWERLKNLYILDYDNMGRKQERTEEFHKSLRESFDSYVKYKLEEK